MSCSFFFFCSREQEVEFFSGEDCATFGQIMINY